MVPVAVVIPLYNHAGYIQAAIESVLVQSRPPQRILVIDDGSTDGSAEVVEKMQATGLQLIRQKNQGAHAALNRGIALADDCQWIAILNSDDVFLPQRLERCLATLARRPRAELLCTGLHLIDSANQPLPAKSPKVRRLEAVWALVRQEPDPLSALAVSNFAKTTSNFVGRRSFFLEHPFPAHRYVHDYHQMVRAALEKKLTVLPEDLLAYRVHDSNTIKSSGKSAVIEETVQMHFELLAEYQATMSCNPALQTSFREYFQRLLGNHTYFRGELSLQLIARAVAIQPGLFSTDSVSDIAGVEGLSRPLPKPDAPPLPTPEKKKRGLRTLLRGKG